MDETEVERLKARIEALEKILRVDAIQASGDAVDHWFHVVQDESVAPDDIRKAGMDAAKEVLNTKNRNRRTGRRRVRVVSSVK